MKTRRTITMGLCTALLLAGAALAQPRHGRAHGNMVDHLATALDLTDAQKATATQLETAMKAQAAPLMQQSQQQRTEIHSLLNGDNPDATQIGEKMIAAKATRAQMKALHDEFKTKFTAILTADQQAKFSQLQQRRQRFQGNRPGPEPTDQ